MLCPLKPKATVNVARYPKLTEHLAWATDYREASRLQEYDEMWSVRWARHVVYGRSEATVTSTLPGPDTNDERYAKWTPPSLLSSLPICGVVDDKKREENHQLPSMSTAIDYLLHSTNMYLLYSVHLSLHLSKAQFLSSSQMFSYICQILLERLPLFGLLFLVVNCPIVNRS
ncbi:hypothetical protein NECAME_01960 [Necator americanus]|uniref:Uncharacterized protein n=1 Tax=Necator americanus TaxID=51031 RepID=W2TKQ0_NECAM|nr:hypothetical protein NECAME_01960 [Necator americanus]ETN82675.1 hypothetical protein NECAME_01960 [Necator americanus]